MELYLQFGFGMMEHCRVLVSKWGSGTVILSPRDLSDKQLPTLSKDITHLPNGAVLLDPQFYFPHADHQRLCSHSYWPSQYQTGLFWQGAPLTKLLTDLCVLNQTLESREFILPGRLASEIDDDWLNIQQITLEAALSLQTGMPLIATIALSADAVRSEEQIARLLERASKWQVHGYYLVCEHPRGEYLVNDATWIANILDLTSGLRLNGAKVILGYCNHQMLIAAAAKANAIASGTWMNVRSFPPDKFQTAYEEEIRTRTVWYYCPQALSEYKIPFLDTARDQGVLTQMAPPQDQDSDPVTALFSGAQPSTIGLLEPAAFRHYLDSLRRQVRDSEAATFDQTVASHDALLDSAEILLTSLRAARVKGQLRDFSDVVDVNRAALGSLIRKRGAMLRRKWSAL